MADINPLTGNPYCTARDPDQEVLCDLDEGHDGQHHAEILWDET